MILIAIVSINAFSMQHVYKLPVLVVHFLDHQKEAEPITIMQYLAMHYGSEEANDEEGEHERDLPFKKAELSANALSLFYSGIQKLFLTTFQLKTFFPTIDVENVRSLPLLSPFRPPRFS